MDLDNLILDAQQQSMGQSGFRGRVVAVPGFPEFGRGGPDDDDIRRGDPSSFFRGEGGEVRLVALEERTDEEERTGEVDALGAFELGQRHVPDGDRRRDENPVVDNKTTQRWPVVAVVIFLGLLGTLRDGEKLFESLLYGGLMGHVECDRSDLVLGLAGDDVGVGVEFGRGRVEEGSNEGSLFYIPCDVNIRLGSSRTRRAYRGIA